MAAVDKLRVSEPDAFGYLIAYLELSGVDIVKLLEEDRDIFHAPEVDFGDIYEGALAEHDSVSADTQWVIIAGIARLLTEDFKRVKENAKDLVYDVLKDEKRNDVSERQGTSKREFFASSAASLVENLRRLKTIEQRLDALRKRREDK